MTGCGCHDPVVFGHLDCDLAPAWARTLLAKRHRGEGEDRALDRRLRELRAGLTRIPGIPYCQMHDRFNCPYAHGYQ